MVGNDSKVRFWTDLWTGDSPLSSRFVRLFQILAEPEGLISQLYRDGRWNISFRRSFGREEQESWLELLDETMKQIPLIEYHGILNRLGCSRPNRFIKE
jgi:hypothetical protein